MLSTSGESRCDSATFRTPTHLQQTGGKALVRQAEEFLDDHFRFGNVRSRPRCRLKSCGIARASSASRAEMLLGSSEIRQAAGALLSDQGLKPQTHQRGFLFDSG